MPIRRVAVTPTAAALSRALAYFSDGAGASLQGEKYVLLATDGGPNCNEALTCTAATCTTNLDKDIASPNFCDASLDAKGPASCLDEAGSVKAVADLARNGVKTFVVGIPGTEAYADTLDLLAAKSGIANPDAPPAYFAVSAEGGVAGLSDVLKRVTTGLITSCRLQLEEEPPVEEELFVVIDSVVIPKGGADGWSYVEGASPPVIQIHGKTCETLESQGAEQINISYGCPITKPR